MLRRLQHRAVAAEDRRERLPGDVGQRRVERDQKRGDARPAVAVSARSGAASTRSSCARTSAGPRRRRRSPSRSPRRSRRARGRSPCPSRPRRSRSPPRAARAGAPRSPRTTLPRSTAVRAPHSTCASRAAATAASASAFPDRATRQRCAAVRGARLVEPGPARGRPFLAGDEVRHLRRYHQADQPPSTTRFAPVTYDDASEARNTTAPTASETSISRPSGERAANASTNGAGCAVLDPVRRQRVDPDAAPPPVGREVAGQVDERGLRDRVRDRLVERLAGLAAEVVEALVGRKEPVDRADVDDRAAARHAPSHRRSPGTGRRRRARSRGRRRASDSTGTSSNGPTSSAGASGGASIAAAFTSRSGTPQSTSTSASAASTCARSVTSHACARTVPSSSAVTRPGAPARGCGLEVEDRHAHLRASRGPRRARPRAAPSRP